MGRGNQEEPAGSGVGLLFSRRRRSLVAARPDSEQGAARRRYVSIDDDAKVLELYDQGKLPRIDEIQCDHHRLADAIVIARSADLYCPTSARGKRYRGYVAVAEDAGGDPIFIGATTYGPSNAPESQAKVYYRGPSLDAACQEVNKHLRQKQTRGRDPYSPGAGTGDPYLDRARTITQLEHAANATNS